MTQTFFITSSGTGTGKTLVTAALAHQLRAAGKRVSALKPVVSGYADDDADNDTARILRSLGQAVTQGAVEAISPWRFTAPLAPNVAARRENREISFADLAEFCSMPRTSEFMLIEGAGGVMAPLTDQHTMLDWASVLACPVILVVGTYLGAISHALTAASVLRARGLVIQAVVVSESETSAMSVGDTARELKQFLPYARYIVPLPRVAGAGDLWQHAADMTWMLHEI